jgi:hypothetical protein
MSFCNILHFSVIGRLVIYLKTFFQLHKLRRIVVGLCSLYYKSERMLEDLIIRILCFALFYMKLKSNCISLLENRL